MLLKLRNRPFEYGGATVGGTEVLRLRLRNAPPPPEAEPFLNTLAEMLAAVVLEDMREARQIREAMRRKAPVVKLRLRHTT